MLLSGKDTADHFLKQIQAKITSRDDGKTPTLAVILVGSDPASHIYVNIKQKKLKEHGIQTKLFQFGETTTQRELKALLQQLNEDPDIDGIITQLPLPAHLNALEIVSQINPKKDVDGLTFVNMGQLLLGSPSFVPCTPLGIVKLLEHYQIPIAKKHVVIVGRGRLVGRPLAALLLKKGTDALVTVIHSQCDDLEKYTSQADILIAAAGVPHLITSQMIKENAVVIDVGVHRIEGKLVGDVVFDEVNQKASAITPVPGGVGPMTVAMLAYNVYQSFDHHH